jgi:uncharacterized UBP type Zn finger protein
MVLMQSSGQFLGLVAIGLAGLVGLLASHFMARNSNPIRRKKRLAARLHHPPAGVVNIGNSCYLGSVLQLLASSARVEAYLEEQTGPVANELREKLAAVNSSKTAVNPSSFIRAICRDGFNSAQQDAHEFLLALLGLLSRTRTEKAAGLAGLLAQHPRRPFLSNSPFEGFAINEFVCPSPVHRQQPSYSVEHLQALTVYPDGQDLQALLLKDLFNPNAVPDYRAACGCGFGVVRLRHAVRLPKVFLVHISMLDSLYRKAGQSSVSPARLPLELNFPPNGQLYSLTGFIEHIGSSGLSGHYVTIRRSGSVWWCCDDQHVSELTFAQVASRLPYILLYESVNSGAL